MTAAEAPTGLVDHAVRERITASGVHDTLFVEAGAGTGKTSTLVARIVHLVLEEGVSLAGLAAITFTEAAAAELRDRVRRAFLLHAAGHDPIAAGRAIDALADFDAAAITTLHGFAYRILSEHPIDVAIPPRVEVLDEVQSLLAFEDRWRGLIHHWQTDPVYEPAVVRLWSLDIELRRARGVSLQDVAAVLDDNWDRLETLDPVPLRAPRPLDRRRLRETIDAALAHVAHCRAADDLLLRHIVKHTPALVALRDLDPADDDRLVRMLRGVKFACGKGKKPNWPDVEVVRAATVAIDEAVAALLGAAADDVLSIWLGVLRDATLAAAQARRDAGRLEFHDLLVLARRLLRSSAPARHALHQRYERLLLDEFQDTDPIQIELALRIAAPPADQPDDWRDLVAPPGRLFFVGDPKQSIYRFRRADIALFHEVQGLFGEAAQVSLVQNFRTVEPIVEWVNAIFGALMTGEPAGRQPRYRALAATRRAAPEHEHRVELFGVAHVDDPRALELRHREAADVAAIVEQIRRDPTARLVAEPDPAGGERWRPARCADITVLIPSRASLPMLEAAFATRDLPYRVDTSTLVFDSPEVRDLLQVLQAVDDPADAIAVVGALRSPVLACRDPELFDWVQHGGSWDYRAAGSEQAAPARAAASSVAEALDHLTTWHEASRWCEPATILERIVRERDVLALGLTHRRPRDVWRRTRFLIDQARQFADVGGGPLRAFVRWCELQRHEGSRVPEPLLPETDDDAVRIMTFHGAKGLEFPIVILSGLTTQTAGARPGPKVHWGSDGRPAVSLAKGKATQHFDVLNDFEAEMDAEEKLRLLYVGATRARDHLLVSVHRTAKDDTNDKASTYAMRVHLTSRDHAAGLDRRWAPPSGASPPAEVTVDIDHAARRTDFDQTRRTFEAWCAARATLLDASRTRRAVWSATAVAAALAAAPPVAPTEPAVMAAPAQDASAVAESPEREPDDPLGTVAGPRRGGTAFGRAVHAVLEVANLEDDRAALMARAARAVEAETADPHSLDVVAVAEAAAHVLASPTVVAARRSSRHWRELELAAPIGHALVEGVVDLLAEIDDTLVLIDYKTDRTPVSELDHRVAHYAPQLAAYSLAVEAATGRSVGRAVLVFVGPDGAVERDVPDLRVAMARVRTLLAGDTPAGDTPAGDSPAGDSPAGDSPAGDSPVRSHG